MKDNVVSLVEFRNKKSSTSVSFSEYPEEIQLELIKEKLYEELEEYYKETMNLLNKFETEFAALHGTTYVINNSAVSEDIVYRYISDVIQAFIENKNILSCDDKRYAEIRTELFKDIEEHYFNENNMEKE
ncbi:MAG: hypothetical protein ACI398_02355 [Clostridium sp.]